MGLMTDEEKRQQVVRAKEMMGLGKTLRFAATELHVPYNTLWERLRNPAYNPPRPVWSRPDALTLRVVAEARAEMEAGTAPPFRCDDA